MDCDEALALLSGYLDQTNTEEEANLLQEHLKECPACRETLHALEALDLGIASLEEEPPADLKENVMAAIAKEQPPRKKRSKPWWPALAAAAVLVCVIGVAGSQLPDLKPASEPALMAENYAGTAKGMMREMPVPDGQLLADRLGAEVAVTGEVLEELEGLSSETLEDGTQLYRLDDAEAASDLSTRYRLDLYYPTDPFAGEISYVWVLS